MTTMPGQCSVFPVDGEVDGFGSDRRTKKGSGHLIAELPLNVAWWGCGRAGTEIETGTSAKAGRKYIVPIRATDILAALNGRFKLFSCHGLKCVCEK